MRQRINYKVGDRVEVTSDYGHLGDAGIVVDVDYRQDAPLYVMLDRPMERVPGVDHAQVWFAVHHVRPVTP